MTPNAAHPQLRLILNLETQCRVSQAVALLDGLLAAQPGNRELWEYLAAILGRAQRFDRAIEAHEQVLRAESRNPRLWLEYGIALRFAGRQPDAVQALRRSLDLDSSYAPAWWVLATMNALETADVARIEKELAQSPHDAGARFLHIALGTVFDRRREYERAWHHFAAGKALAAKAARYDPDRFERSNSEAIRSFDKDFFDQRHGFGAGSAAPIFIVGLPRSGSTLVERILGGHSEIEAAGELPIIPSLMQQLETEGGRKTGFGDLLPAVSRGRAQELGELYLSLSREYRKTDKPFFIDKLHMNWMHLPFIRLILPNARIIDVRRDPLDCCWSNFKTLFTSGHPAADDLGHIGRFYREYVRMADHAAELWPKNVLKIRYEDVVGQLEAETRRMLDFLGLDYDPACLEFHRLETPVATISAEQVRRPLNNEGIGAWKPYREWLGPLAEALGPLAPMDV